MKERKTNTVSIVILLVSILFYLVLFILDGVQLSADSNSYLNSSYGREPLYPVILLLFRTIIPAEGYLSVVVFLQCMLAAFSVYHLTMVLKKKFNLDPISTAGVLFLQFAVVLLCKMVAVRKATYCNEICSEGIAIPLFTLFLTELIVFAWYSQYKSILLCMIYGALLVSTRKQMYIVFVIMAGVYGTLWLCRRIRIQKLLIATASVVCAAFLAIGMDVVYNLGIRGEAMRHTTDSSALVIMTIYSSSKEDADAFENEDMKELFLSIMEEVEENKYNYPYASGNFLSRYDHYASHYDKIAFGVVNPHFYEYLDTHFSLTENERARKFDEINSVFLKTLLPVRWGQILAVAGSNMLVGLCNTFAKAQPLLAIYSFLFLLGYILLFLYCLRQKKEDLCLMAFTCMAAVFVNVIVVGLMIFAQTRYMIYNMPFVYIAMFLMVREIFLNILTKRRQKKETA